MAVVFKAKQISLDRTVAIKVLPKKLSADKEYVERFYQEGQAAAKLNHPNIVAAIDVAEAQGYHYFVMEYVEGITVDDDLKTGKVYSESEALNITIQIARALEHAHAQGMIHRDVKPKNILLTPDGTAKLMDMGLARIADDAEAIESEQGRLFGTPYYISPEQILGKADVDFHCDIYSLGATLYHMLTGKVPFEGDDAKAVMIKHVKQKLTPPDRLNINISFGTVKIIQRMMAKHPHQRFDSTGELLNELESLDFLLEVENPADSTIRANLSHLNNAKSRPATKPAPTPPKTIEYVQTKNPTNTNLIIALVVSGIINILLILLLIAQL